MGKEKAQKRRTFDAAFKQAAVVRAAERRAAGVSVEHIARDLGVQPEMLRAWKKQLEAGGGAALPEIFPGHGKAPSADDEVRRLRRELEVVRQERDFLKKATAFFAKESR